MTALKLLNAPWRVSDIRLRIDPQPIRLIDPQPAR
jgi:hypothetical protein